MKIIIVGLGKTGMLLADNLSRENHDVTVVDKSKEKIEAATDRYSVSGVCGSGASKSVLTKAGADTADAIIALMPSDEANLMTCMTAKNAGTRYAALRLQSPEFVNDREHLKKEFGIDHIVNPKRDTANEISRQIGLPGLVKADAFFSTDAVMLRTDVHKDNPLAGKALKDVRGIFDADMLMGCVKREEKIFVPDGSFIIEEGDTISIISPHGSLEKIVTKLGLVRKPVKNVFIVGGGTTGFYLAEKLLSEGKRVTILESCKERCIELSEQLPKASVAYAEDVDSDILIAEGIKNSDVCVSLTGEDEKNLVISLFAWSCGISSIITKVNIPSYERLLNKVKIDITVSPTVICSDMLMRFIRNVT
ncbi:MAG: Trk system potassium transporter TrkA, partial [Huintestinicola sp.]